MKKNYTKRKWLFELSYNEFQTVDISLDTSSIDDSVYTELLEDIKYFKKINNSLPVYTDGRSTLQI